MTDRQNEIYKGLNSIGPEIANFYFDGVNILSCDLASKSYILAHLLREIDGGLRDIFEQERKKEQFQKEITAEALEKLFNEFKEDYKHYDYLKDITFEKFKAARGHISSIMVSFGFSFESPVSKQYIKVALWLNKYAHRSGAFNTPRAPKDVIQIWSEFEEVLSNLIGDYYALADRMDSLVQMEEPSGEVLRVLPNLLSTESKYVYFFSTLKHPKWLTYLFKEGYFKGSLNPEPIEAVDKPGYFSMPDWRILQYIEEVSNQNLLKQDPIISETLVLIIKDIISYKKDDGCKVENSRTDYSIFRVICALPEKYISDEHFDFIMEVQAGKWYSGVSFDYGILLERLINIGNKGLLVKAIGILLKHRYVEEETYEKVFSIFQPYDLSRMLADYKPKLIGCCGLELLEIAIKKATEVIKLDQSMFNNISLPALEDHEQTSFPENYSCQIVYLIRDCLEVLPREHILVTLKNFLAHENPIFNRLAIHTIKLRYDEFNELFWKWNDNPLNNTLVKHELYELIRIHSKEFSPDQIDQILYWIENQSYEFLEDIIGEEEKVKSLIAYSKLEWLSAFGDTSDPRILKLKEQLSNGKDINLDHPGFDSWHGSIVGTISPLTIEELVKMNIEDIVSFFKEFSTTKQSFMGPSINGLSDVIVLAVRKNPNHFNSYCDAILDSPTHFMYSWIRGLHECWRDEKITFDCVEILQTVRSIIIKSGFWNEYNESDVHARWFISSLLSFLEVGLQDDLHAFPPSLLKLIKEILICIFEKDEYEVYDYKNLTMTVLNNPKGKIFMALMQYSLRVARVEPKPANMWDEDIKRIFTRIITAKEDAPLCYFVLGQFLPNIQFLDSDWLSQNFKNIYPNENENNWIGSMSGYFVFHRRPNKLFFGLFKEHGHFQKAFQNNFENLDEGAMQNIIEHVCIAYLYEELDVNFDNPLIKTMINTKNERCYSSLIFFFWSPKFSLDKSVLHRIKPLWGRIFLNSIELKDPQIDKYILSGCCKWVSSIPEIDDEIVEWMKQSAKFISQQDRYSIINGLSKHINTTPGKVGEILLELFKNEVSYDVSRGKVKEMVKILFENGYKKIASDICIIHAEKGNHDLRDIFIKFKD
jgi:hypothetical protein